MSSKQTVTVVDFPTETETPVFIKFVKLKKLGLKLPPFLITIYEFCFGNKIDCTVLYLFKLRISLDEVKPADSEKRGFSDRKTESCYFFHELDSNLLNFFLLTWDTSNVPA